MEEVIETAMNPSYHNYPRKIGKKEYDEALNELIGRYSSNDLVAIYDWGMPSVPGISDLDVLLVWKQSPSPLTLKNRVFVSLSKKTQYVLYHPPLHISANEFGDIPYVYPKGSLRKVWGTDLNINQLSKNEHKEANASLLNDIIVRHYPRDFLSQAVHGKIDIRGSLLRLNSLKYTFETMKAAGVKVESVWEKFSKEVEDARYGWFESEDGKKVLELSTEALLIMMGIIEKSQPLMIKRWRKVIGEFPNEMKFDGIKNKSIFLREWDTDAALKQMRSYALKGKQLSILPLCYAAQLASYSESDGPISKHIRANFHPAINLEDHSHSVVRKRIMLFNHQANLSMALKHSDFPAFFDFGYRNPSGMNNLLLRALDKIRFQV
jgi:hypothetical protein